MWTLPTELWVAVATGVVTVIVGAFGVWPKLRQLRAEAVEKKFARYDEERKASLRMHEEERLNMARARDALAHERESLMKDLRMEMARLHDENNRQRKLSDGVYEQLAACALREKQLLEEVLEIRQQMRAFPKHADRRGKPPPP